MTNNEPKTSGPKKYVVVIGDTETNKTIECWQFDNVDNRDACYQNIININNWPDEWLVCKGKINANGKMVLEAPPGTCPCCHQGDHECEKD